MTIKTPCELVVRKLLPLIRGLLAVKLYSEGFSQCEIAKLIGVTQATINGYVKHDERYYVSELSKLGIPLDTIQNLVKSLKPKVLKGDVNLTMNTLCTICKGIRGKGYLCNYHISVDPQLKGCNVCLKVKGEEILEEEVLESLRAAIIMLEHSQAFPHIIPEVNTNLVMAKKGAISISDVAGIPGRIVKVLGRAKAVSEPSFGASHHMAKVLLAALEVDPNVRAAINVKYDERLRRAMEVLGLKYIMVQGKPRKVYVSEDDIVKDIRRLLKRLGYVPDAVVDHGGLGVEPIAYIFGEDAIDVAQKAISIASAYTMLSKA